MELENNDPEFDEEYYYCNNCDSKINCDEIQYNELTCVDICPKCGSNEVDYCNNSTDY